MSKTYQEINEKIRKGQAVVVTAEEMVGIVKKKGPARAARDVDVVTTGTFAPMCSSGAFINFGHTQPPIKASKVLLNDVPAYGGLAAVDIYIGATEPTNDDPLNKVRPGSFDYGGGHVLHDLVAGKSVTLRAEAYGTDCYPNRFVEMSVMLDDLPYAVLCNPRNAYQNYNCAVNLSGRTIYTYMGTLKPRLGNANYSTSGQFSPLLNDPYYRTLGLGTRIFLAGAEGYIIWQGSQHNPNIPRLPNGVPRAPAGTLMVLGDLKQMHPRWLIGVSLQGYGCSLALGIGIPIPILGHRDPGQGLQLQPNGPPLRGELRSAPLGIHHGGGERGFHRPSVELCAGSRDRGDPQAVYRTGGVRARRAAAPDPDGGSRRPQAG